MARRRSTNAVGRGIDMGALTPKEIGIIAAEWRLAQFGEVSAADAALHLNEEASEVARVIVKTNLGIRASNRGDLEEEIGDVILTVCAMAIEQGINPDTAARRCLDKLPALDFVADPDTGGKFADSTPVGSDHDDPGFDRIPSRYNQHGRETIDIIRDSMTDSGFADYCHGNALKYELRAGAKGGPDAEKARWYRMMCAHVERPDENPDPRHERPGFIPYVRQPDRRIP